MTLLCGWTVPKRREWEESGPCRLRLLLIQPSTFSIPVDSRGYAGRSHSLWYCDAKEQGIFRWYETAFMRAFRGGGEFAPFAMSPDSPDASLALSPTMHTYNVAWPFMSIDQGDEESFIERWMGWFGDAAQGQMRYPSPMPDSGSWRRGS